LKIEDGKDHSNQKDSGDTSIQQKGTLCAHGADTSYPQTLAQSHAAGTRRTDVRTIQCKAGANDY